MTPEDVQVAFDHLRRGAAAEPNPSAAAREDRLERLEALLVEHAEGFVAAASADFGGRSRHETLLADVVATLDSVRTARKQLRAWMRPEPVKPSPFFRPSTTWVEPIPKGVVGIIAPWNYPVNLALAPLAGALAAGNRALIKPSEHTPRVATILAHALRDHFSSQEIGVVEGGPEVAQAVSALPLDHLIFTGSTTVGRLVATAAAPNLVPVTLELGGKSPALIHPDAPIAHAADRIAVGKLFNAGQTCIAPDYVLLPKGKEEVFVQAFRDAVQRRWGDPMGSPDYTAIASERGHARLRALIGEARRAGARIEQIGEAVKGDRRLPPTLVLDLPEGVGLMREEIFGPVLPVLTYERIGDALELVQSRSRPLAFYLFDPVESRARETLAQVVSGGAVINDTLVHFAQEHLPFGGIGASGMGVYHGRAGFDACSHRRGVMWSSPVSPARALLGPPYGAAVEAAIRGLMGRLGRLV